MFQSLETEQINLNPSLQPPVSLDVQSITLPAYTQPIFFIVILRLSLSGLKRNIRQTARRSIIYHASGREQDANFKQEQTCYITELMTHDRI